MIFAIAAAAAAAAAPAPKSSPMNTCKPPESCRWVDDFEVRGKSGEVSRIKVSRWLPPWDKGALTLFMGETIVLRFDRAHPDAPPQLLSLGRADRLPRNKVDDRAEQTMLDMWKPDREAMGSVAAAGEQPAVVPEADTIRVTLTQIKGRADTVLKVDNGYGDSLVYSAEMLSENTGALEKTTVCPVPAGKGGYEQWPYAIMLIRLSDFTFRSGAQPRHLSDCG